MLNRIISMVLILSLIMVTSVYAHSGNTDSNGCHNDYINGGYHCHNGGDSGGSGGDSSGLIIGAVIVVAVVVLVWIVTKHWGSNNKTLSEAVNTEKLPINVEMSSNLENDGINGTLQLSHSY